MKTLDKFLIHDLGKTFKKTEVAFYIDDICTYKKALASVRMRCYDIMEYFEKLGIGVELYKPFKKYKVVFFIKTREDKAVRLARKLHAEGTIVSFDGYCEYLLDDNRKEDKERVNILEIAKVSDVINACSKEQQRLFSHFHDNVRVVNESVHDDFFKVHKKHTDKKKITLVYCGYSSKAKDTLCIEPVIKRLIDEGTCEMLYICEKDPQIKAFPYRYLPYDQNNIPNLLIEGDIMIAPRPMEKIELLSHSFTKVAYPLSVGLPAVACPVPSYIDTPVILCETNEEWYHELNTLSKDTKLRQKIGDEGRNYVKEFYSVEKIGNLYLETVKSAIQ